MSHLEKEIRASGSEHIPALDGIRSVALFLVFLRHLIPPVESPSGIEAVLWRVQWIGWTGVDLFFVLSGFLITRILLRDCGKHNALKRFYAFRLVRIWPNYLLVVAVALVLSSFLADSLDASWLWNRQGWLWLHLANWLIFFDGPLPFNLTILWSLAVEEQFYLFWPLLVYCVPEKRVVQFSWIYLSVVPFVRLAVLLSRPEFDMNVFTPLRLDGFVLGGLLAISSRSRPSALRNFFNHQGMRRVVLLAATAYLLLILIWQRGIFYQGILVQSFGYLAIATLFSLLVGAAISNRLPVAISRWLGGKMLGSVAKVSYGAYLIHHPLSWLFQNCGLTDSLRSIITADWVFQLSYLFLASLIALILAWMLCQGFEKWFLMLKRPISRSLGFKA